MTQPPSRASSSDTQGTPRWLRGDYPSEAFRADLKALAALPHKVRDDFWEVLQPNLAEALDDRVGAVVAKFCRSREVEPDSLIEPVRVARWTLYQAARFNLEPSQIATDLERIDEIASAILTPCYTQARQQLRLRIIRNSLAQHGKLVRSIGWRIDTVRRTHDGAGIDLPIALITFRYTEGERDERITLQMMPEAIDELFYALKDIVG